MGRSYLFRGKDVEHLSPGERQLEALYDRLDRPGNRLTDTQFYALPETAQLLDSIYGSLTDRIPPGSQIMLQTPSKVTYRDTDGYEHTLTRNARDGRVTTATNRPAILPDKAQQSTLDLLRQRVEQGFTSTPTLAELDPATAAALQAISDAESGALDQELEDLKGQLIARLYSNGVNQSSIANEAGARFAESAGRAKQQQRSDAAQRLLGLRQYLTTLTQAGRESNANLYANLTGQSNQRDIAGAGFTLDRAKLDEGARQFDLSNYLQTLQTQIEQEKLDLARGPFNKFLGLLNAGANVAQGVGTGLAAYGALTGGDKK